MKYVLKYFRADWALILNSAIVKRAEVAPQVVGVSFGYRRRIITLAINSIFQTP